MGKKWLGFVDIWTLLIYNNAIDMLIVKRRLYDNSYDILKVPDSGP